MKRIYILILHSIVQDHFFEANELNSCNMP